MSRVCPAGPRALPSPRAALTERGTPALPGLCRGLPLAIALQIPLGPSGAFALGLSLFHLPEKRSAISLEGGEVVLLQVRRCQQRGQALSSSSRMELDL